MADYVYDDDPRYQPYEELLGDRVAETVTPYVPHDDVWKAFASQSGINTDKVAEFTGVNVGEGDEYRYVENPEFLAFKQAMKDAGYKIGMSDIPGYKFDKNFTIFNPDGTPMGDPLRVTIGEGFFSGISSLAKETAPVWMSALTFGGGAAALGSMIAPGASAATQAALGNAIISGGTTALGGGNFEDVLKSAGIAAATPYIGQNVSPAVSESLGGGATGAAGSAALRSGITQLLSTGEIDPGKLALSAIKGGAKGYVPDVPSGGTGEEGFFDIGGEGYSPYEEQYGFVADPMPGEDYFDQFQQIGSSPDGNLEQDFVVDQNGNIIDNAGNRGEFVDGEWVVRTDPKDFLNYVGPPAPAPAPAPAAPKPPAPAAAPAPAAQKGLDLGALMAMLGGMYGAQEQAAPEYATARVTNVSPFGLPYGMRG